MVRKLVPDPFLNFQGILSKKEAAEASMLIWTNFDSFAIIYLSRLLQKFHFPMKVVLNSLQTKKSLDLILRLQFLLNVLIKLFPVEYNMN